MCQKMAPQTLDQSEGDKVCGPDQSDKINYGKGIVGLMEKDFQPASLCTNYDQSDPEGSGNMP